MEEFNKMSDNEILKEKNKSLKILVFITMLLGPMIFFFFISAVSIIFVLNESVFVISLLFLMILVIIYEFFYKKYAECLIYGRDIEIDSNKKAEDKTIKENTEGYVLKNEMYIFTEAEVLDKLLSADKDFSKTHFYSYAKSLFILIQEAWSNNDYQKLRFFEDDRLFYKHKKEILDLINSGKNDIRDKVNIKGVLLKDFKIVKNKEILIVAITAGITRNYDGYETRHNYPYLLAFSRNVGVKTNPNIVLSSTNCWNCGAVIDVSDDGICNYCNTSLVSGEHEWVLVDLKLLDNKIRDNYGE